MPVPANCPRCGSDWFCSSPDYGDGAQFAHYCSRTGYRETTTVNGYTKADSHRDAGQHESAKRFK